MREIICIHIVLMFLFIYVSGIQNFKTKLNIIIPNNISLQCMSAVYISNSQREMFLYCLYAKYTIEILGKGQVKILIKLNYIKPSTIFVYSKLCW